MSTDSQRLLPNGTAGRHVQVPNEVETLDERMKKAPYDTKFHGDNLIGDPRKPHGFFADLGNSLDDFQRILTLKNVPAIGRVASKLLSGGGLDVNSGAQLVASMSNDSNRRAALIESQVKTKYERMLHPPLTYLGDKFQYRTADGSFNSVLHPHLGQGGAPYAKTVPSITHPLGALPDPGDLFDRLMARQEGGRTSKSGLSSMLIYHATIIIHDIFRTNEKDKNISDSSSYLDLSPLYGYTEKMVRSVRDDKYKLGLLKPDTFAEDRLLRQPPGVCIMLVMYNRYHNYAATQLRRINENGRFAVPTKYSGKKLAAVAKKFMSLKDQSRQVEFDKAIKAYDKAWDQHHANENDGEIKSKFDHATKALQAFIDQAGCKQKDIADFEAAYDAAWDKLDDDLFNTARLITCGQYVQVSVHDYLRALMGFHQYDTNFTYDPRKAYDDHKEVTRGLGNQVTVEFNVLYRFHCAISMKDERYAEDFMRQTMKSEQDPTDWNPKKLTMQQFAAGMAQAGRAKAAYEKANGKTQPWEQTFGLPKTPELNFQRHPITGLFDDEQMVKQLIKSMDDPISNFGPRNTPRCLKNVEILGITQARKWEVGTLNDFRQFFGMSRHDTFESITPNKDVQNALRDLYEHPDKVELYPGVFCESDADMGDDPGPTGVDSALWAAIFSDAITLVRSDRFYTTDWNTNSLTSWGMKEVTSDNEICKSSVFHRLLQRAFPEWFPYDSIRFFHPFYTSQTNAKFAQAQGYANDFRMDVFSYRDLMGHSTYSFDTDASNPNKPAKPLYLYQHDQIEALLLDGSDTIVHPARLQCRSLPPKVAEVLTPGKTKDERPKPENIKDVPADLMRYFTDLAREIILREFVNMTTEENKPIYQIDIVRDFAIPVTVRYVADLLGFGSKVRTVNNLGAPYSENEIYQHITNCQTFLSYNIDETKMLKRRKAFQTSMTFLYNLTKEGSILEASRGPIARCSINTLRYVIRMGRKKTTNAMVQLGLQVARQVFDHEKDFGRAAAILLLIALDSAYNSVLAFTTVANKLIAELYDHAKTNSKTQCPCAWLELQKLAFETDKKSVKRLSDIVLNAQRTSVKLPIIRKATTDRPITVFKEPKPQAAPFPVDEVRSFTVQKGQVVICDIHRAGQVNPSDTDEERYLPYRSTFTEKFAHFQPKNIAVLSLEAMIKTLAQMKNLRRGHTAQGQLKKVNIDASYEGYANYMAPDRMLKIESDVHRALKGKLWVKQNGEDVQVTKDEAAKVFNTKILKPSLDTFLTPEWDEMVPFPNTWKVRFEGFGASDYGGKGRPMLQPLPVADDAPPYYQPRGPSHNGGAFGDAVCHCEEVAAAVGNSDGNAKARTPSPAAQTPAHTCGCGFPG